MKKKLLCLSLMGSLIIGMAGALSAAVPPPPVNQTKGTIYDTKFGKFLTEDCIKCHNDQALLVTRHHNLINSTVPAVSCVNASKTTPTTLATGCHVQVPAPDGVGYVFQDFRDCLNCHTGQSPHHMTTWAADQDCQYCHGKIVIDNPKDGHYIPNYVINTDSTTGGVTPAPKGRAIPDPNNPGKTIITQGCAACHQADPTAVPPIFSNADLHHGTNIGSFLQPGGVGACNWCHDSGSTIRGCEQCHGVKSLHNIQFDSNNPNNLGAIVPAKEDFGYGHIGNNMDCQGCHSSWNGSIDDSTGATVAAISSLSTPLVTTGTQTQLVINGAGFTNIDTLGNSYNPVVTLTNDGNTITLTPYSFTNTEIKVLLPALQQGNYELRVAKNGAGSNLTKLVVAPKLSVKAAMLSGNSLTITGVGFGSAPTVETKALLGVFVDATQARVVSWSDGKIVASSPAFAAGKTVTVKTLYGPVNGAIFAAGKKVK